MTSLMVTDYPNRNSAVYHRYSSIKNGIIFYCLCVRNTGVYMNSKIVMNLCVCYGDNDVLHE